MDSHLNNLSCLQEVDQLSSFCTEQLATATSAVASVSLNNIPLDDFIHKVHASGELTSGTEYGSANAGQDRNRTRGDGSTTEETSPTLPPVDSPPTVRLPRIDVDLTLDSSSSSNNNNINNSQNTTVITSHIGMGTVGSPPMHNQRRTRRPSNPTPDDQPGVRSPPQPSSKALDGVSAFAGSKDYTSGRKRQTMFIPADVDVMTEGAIPSTDNHLIVAQTPRSPILTGVKVDEVDDENMLDTGLAVCT